MTEQTVIEGQQEKEARTELKDYPITLTAKHVAEILGISLVKAYDIMEQPDFPLIRIGRHKKVNREAFFRWMQQGQKVVSG